jgi:hypothetical protein
LWIGCHNILAGYKPGYAGILKLKVNHARHSAQIIAEPQ